MEAVWRGQAKGKLTFNYALVASLYIPEAHAYLDLRFHYQFPGSEDWKPSGKPKQGLCMEEAEFKEWMEYKCVIDEMWESREAQKEKRKQDQQNQQASFSKSFSSSSRKSFEVPKRFGFQ